MEKKVPVKEEILKLIELQKIDSQVLSLKKVLEEKPREIDNLQKAFEEKKSGLKTLEDNLKNLLVKRKEKENELLSKEEQTKKLQGQLYALKTNKEYQAMLGQIQSSKADCSIIEGDILVNFEAVDKVNIEAKKEKEYLAVQEKALQEEKDKVKKVLDDVNIELKTLEEKRQIMAKDIDVKILAHYEKVLNGRGGKGIVEVKDDICQGCFMNTRPQVINEIRLGKDIITCQMCSRILYITEE